MRWLFLCTFILNIAWAQENADAFIVTIKDDRIRVVSPKEKTNLRYLAPIKSPIHLNLHITRQLNQRVNTKELNLTPNTRRFKIM